MMKPAKARSHEWIDQRSLALDRAIEQMLRSQPELLERARTTLARWIEQGRACVPPVFLEWKAVLDDWPLDRILALLERADETARRLRQSSPFCGLLSPERRLAIFKEYESLAA